MNRWKLKQIIGIILAILVFIIYYSPPIQAVRKFPSELKLTENQSQIIPFSLPLDIKINMDKVGVLKINGQSLKERTIEQKMLKPLIIQPQRQGTAALRFKLFGFIPIKDLALKIVPEVKVFAGGQAIGVTLYTKGALVVGISEFKGQDGKIHHPADDAGLLPGDVIEKANDIVITDADHLSQIINAANGRPIDLQIDRNGRKLQLSIQPAMDSEDQKYKLGIWTRDSTAGVGTLTFYEPTSNMYGALGHPITDVDTGSILSVKDGQIVYSEVIAVKQGEKGKPGELRGVFLDEEKKIGNIMYNTPCGIFGKIYDDHLLDEGDGMFHELIPVALQTEVHEGSAVILATVDDQGVKAYNIEIIKVNHQTQPNGKSMIIKITDPTLLKITGGIVQGMSGSPIIQDGKLVGAVTHVFVNDPSRGYGIFAEWMMEEIGIKINNDTASEYPKAMDM